MRKILIIISLFTIHFGVIGQEKLHVFSQTVTKSFDVINSSVLEVEGEKALIRITGTTSREVTLKLKFISKSTEKGVAENGLSFHKYTTELSKGVIIIENQIALPKSKATSDLLLSVEMEISIPSEMSISVKDSYGQIILENLKGTKQITGTYGNITLNNIEGITTLSSYYGDLNIHDIKGRTSLNLEFSPGVIDGISGYLGVKTSYSDLRITTNQSIEAISINASKSDIEFEISNYKRYRYFVQADFGELRLLPAPENQPKSDISNRKVWTYGNQTSNLIELKSYFGNIILKLE